MFAQLSAVVFLALISLSYSEFVSSGQCEDRTQLSPVNYFNLSAFASEGRLWYTILTTSVPSDCQTAYYNLLNSTAVDFHWKRKDLSSGVWIGRDDGIQSFAPISEKNEGILVLTYPNATEGMESYIIGTNYDEYALHYRCVNLNETTREERLYARSRNSNFTEEQAAAVQQVLVDNGVDDMVLTYSEQDPELCSED